ncbi:MAG TPA: hypothetical protein DEB24_00415 [Coriobacteriia bacterium]|nr:hypothetical protein [Coriobacteriia bacterium]
MDLLSTTALIAAVVCAGICGVVGFPLFAKVVSKAANRMRLKGRVTGQLGSDGFIATVLRNGFPFLGPLCEVIRSFPAAERVLEMMTGALRVKGYEVRSSSVSEVSVVSLALVSALGILLFGQPIVAIVVAVIALIFVYGRAKKILERWNARLVEQIPDAIRSLGICFSSGFSLRQAFEQVAGETEEPLGGELKRTAYDIGAGKSVQEALSALEFRTRVEDFKFVVIALEVQHRTGGSLRDLLENAADAVVAGMDLRRQLQVQTAQARLSAKVVTLLPLVLVGILSLTMEGYLASFFSGVEGFTLLLIAVVMEVSGILVIRRILGLRQAQRSGER